MTPAATEERPLFSPYPRLTPCLLLLAATLVAYANSFNNAFLFDDNLIITLNEYLKSWGTLGKLLTGSTISGAHVEGGFYRPIQMLLYFIIYQIQGPITFGFHALNIALHATNACLLFTLGRKLKFNAAASFLAALIWALHPIHTEAITYMSGTADPLMAMFCLFGTITLFPDFTPRRFYIACGFMIAGLLAKEVAVMFPFLATVTLYAAHPERNKWRTYIRTWPLWVIGIGYTVWRMTASWLDGPQTYDKLYQVHDFYNMSLYAENTIYRIYTCLATLPAYAQLLLWPSDLRMERSFPVYVRISDGMVLGGLALCIVSAAIIFRKSKNEHMRPLAWGLLWFAAAHLPDSGLLIPVNAFFLEHWMYLPSAGLFLGIGQTLANVIPHSSRTMSRTTVATTLGVALALGTATYFQNQVWENPVTFYTHVFKYGEVSARAHNNLALAYMDRNEPEKAFEEFRRAIETSDTYAETRHNFAIALLKMPNQAEYMQEAIGHLKRAIEIDPKFYRSYGMLAMIYKFQGKDALAEEYKAKAEELMKPYVP